MERAIFGLPMREALLPHHKLRIPIIPCLHYYIEYNIENTRFFSYIRFYKGPKKLHCIQALTEPKIWVDCRQS